ncbi:MAG: hypothetical protein JWM80_5457 [Cyanobacteria bacterium RYN_339]|nr:hypothetical protein [Cyanobacteria bacterium RYN_339]
MSGPALYSAAQVEQIPWPATADGDYARRYLAPMLREGTQASIENVDTRLHVLVWDDLVMPVTVNDAEYDNCYVVAPYNHYVVYAREELRMLGEQAVLDGVLAGLGGLLQLGEINKNVQVNNWMLSTNLYPDLTAEQLLAIRELLLRRFPDHAIVFRSINTVLGDALLEAFKDQGYTPIASRRLYYMWADRPEFFDKNQRKIWKKDLKLLETGPYARAVLTEADLPRVLEVYNQLYLDKYSLHNPRFTLDFVKRAFQYQTLELRALRHKETGIIDGAIGFFIRNGAMTTPLFGYDITLPQELGLYRMLSMLTYLESRERHLLLNQSSGAGNFKRTRGGRPNIEYSVVYDQHLWPHRRLAWQGLARAINGVAVPLLEQYKL